MQVSVGVSPPRPQQAPLPSARKCGVRVKPFQARKCVRGNPVCGAIECMCGQDVRGSSQLTRPWPCIVPAQASTRVSAAAWTFEEVRALYPLPTLRPSHTPHPPAPHRDAGLNHTRPASAHALVGAGECSVALYGVARRRCRVSLLPPSADHVLMRISTRLARQGVIRYHPASNMRVIIPLREDPPK